jgi:hypothetical protein
LKPWLQIRELLANLLPLPRALQSKNEISKLSPAILHIKRLVVNRKQTMPRVCQMSPTRGGQNGPRIEEEPLAVVTSSRLQHVAVEPSHFNESIIVINLQ